MGFVCFSVGLQKVTELHLFQRFLMNTRIQVLAYINLYVYVYFVFRNPGKNTVWIQFLPYIMPLYRFGPQCKKVSILTRVVWYKAHSTPTAVAGLLK